MGHCFAKAAPVQSLVYVTEGTPVHPKLEAGRRPARVVRVIDGDTVELLIRYKLAEITSIHSSKWRAPTKYLWITKTCRLYGIDAAEKTTEQGKFARALLDRKLRSLTQLWVKIAKDNDKYGRTLVELYETETAGQTIYSEWVGAVFDGVGVVCVPYDGGKKTAWLVLTQTK